MISGAGIARGGISSPELGPSAGAGLVSGIASVSGVGVAALITAGAADGIAAVAGSGASIAEAAGASSASCAVSGVASVSGISADGAGLANGVCTVAGIGAARASCVGAVDGVATAFWAGAAVLERSTTVWRRYIVSSFRQELTPPILSAEQAVVDFDFGGAMIAGEAVLLPPVLTCSATYGTDAAASARIIGSATVNPSPSTGIADAAVAQLVGGMNGATRYKIQCTVATTMGQTLSRSAYLNCNN